MTAVSSIDGTSIEYAVEIFTLFQNHAFIAGTVKSPRQISGISLVVGQRTVSLPTYNTLTGYFTERVEFLAEERASLQSPKIEITFANGGKVLFADLMIEPLSRETFWPTANIALDEMCKKSSGTVLEVGSRARSGISRRDTFTPPGWTYVGFDVMAGTNVDIVGDAHEISTHFPANTFDAVFSLAVLEHIMMPWKFVVELNRVLKVGAIGVFVTHQAYPVHDQPWDFWRFSDMAWTALLNPKTGFEIIQARMSEPAFLVPRYHHGAVDHNEYMSYQSSAVVFRKISDTSLTWDVNVSDISETHYPAGEVPSPP